MLKLNHRLRLARRIEAAWLSRLLDVTVQVTRDLETLDDYARTLRDVGTRLIYTQRRGWHSIGADLLSNYNGQIESASRFFRQLVEQQRSILTRQRRLGEWLEEFDQLEEEFGEFNVEWDRRCVSVATEPITLRDVDLGPFAIELFWERLARRADSSCFEVIALEPNPAACNEHVTHPHVREGELCAGDASTPIERALADGRIADAVLLVRSVLQCYNPHSPFVSLDHWSGTPCRDCGTIEDPDQLSFCEGCDGDFCSACFTCCTACDCYRCTECLSRCDVCRSSHCEGCLGSSTLSGRSCCAECLTSCTQCGELFAIDELVDETQLCAECHAEPESTDDDDNTPTNHEDTHVNTEPILAPASAPAGTDFCADGVAETPVLLPSG